MTRVRKDEDNARYEDTDEENDDANEEEAEDDYDDEWLRDDY